MAPLRILVVGGGVGGLAAAAFLARSGHQVTVYERSKHTGGVGYAFRITPNSDRVLRHLGIDSVAGGACAATSNTMLRDNGAVVMHNRENTAPTKGGATSVFAYRPQLLRQLYDVAAESGVELKLGAKITAVDADTSTIHLEDGSAVEGDVIIGSDGVHSVVRPQVVDVSKHYPTASSNHNAFRFMIATDTVKQDPELGPLFVDDVTFISWTGPAKFIIAYPVDFGKQLNLVCSHPQELTDVANGGGATTDHYNHRIAQQQAIDIYRDFEPRARRFLELADPAGFRAWKLLDMDELPRWSRQHTVLVGDCCHPLLPFGFSGASMALEDAAVLATLLPKGTAPPDVRARLGLYEQIRKPRLDRVRTTSRKIAADAFGKQDVMEYFAFLGKYDAVEDAKQHLAQQTAA